MLLFQRDEVVRGAVLFRPPGNAALGTGERGKGFAKGARVANHPEKNIVLGAQFLVQASNDVVFIQRVVSDCRV